MAEVDYARDKATRLESALSHGFDGDETVAYLTKILERELDPSVKIGAKGQGPKVGFIVTQRDGGALVLDRGGFSWATVATKTKCTGRATTFRRVSNGCYGAAGVALAVSVGRSLGIEIDIAGPISIDVGGPLLTWALTFVSAYGGVHLRSSVRNEAVLTPYREFSPVSSDVLYAEGITAEEIHWGLEKLVEELSENLRPGSAESVQSTLMAEGWLSLDFSNQTVVLPTKGSSLVELATTRIAAQRQGKVVERAAFDLSLKGRRARLDALAVSEVGLALKQCIAQELGPLAALKDSLYRTSYGITLDVRSAKRLHKNAEDKELHFTRVGVCYRKSLWEDDTAPVVFARLKDRDLVHVDLAEVEQAMKTRLESAGTSAFQVRCAEERGWLERVVFNGGFGD